MRNIFYSSALFHKAVKRTKPKIVEYYRDFWFYSRKAVLCYTPENSFTRDAMFDWLKKQGIEVMVFE